MTRYPDPLLITVVLLFISWPVFFFLIRRHAKANQAWAGWRHLAFWLGPIGALLIFVGLKRVPSGKVNIEEKSGAITPSSLSRSGHSAGPILRQSMLWVLCMLVIVAVAEAMQSHMFDSPQSLDGADMMVNVVREDSGQINRYTGQNVSVAIPDFGDVHFPAGTDMRMANAACRELYLQGQQYKHR